MKILIIVPAYNEEKNIINVCKRLKKFIKSTKLAIDYIVINDGSKDDTYNICMKYGYPVINLVQNLGIGGAVQTGYKYALKNDYDIAIQFDGDGQHDENYIVNLVMPIVNGIADMTIGSRYIQKLSEFRSTKTRQIGIKTLSKIIKINTGIKIYDVTSGFRAVNKDIIKIFANDYPIDYPEPETITTILKRGGKILEIPVKMHERLFGESSITLTKSFYYMIKVSYSIFVRGITERRSK